jgi:hypothetical protein
VSEYVQWRREGKGFRRIRGSTTQPVEALNIRKNSNLMGLTKLKSVKGFWNVMDKKYYNALGKASVEFAIADVKSLDRADKGFLQEIRRKLNTHRRHMDKSNMGHHITNYDMVKKHWVPLLTEPAREAWDRVENYNVIR